MSKLEEKFEFFWNALKGPPLMREYRFHPVRQWRFDFADPEKKLAIEIMGGTYVNGGHNRGAQYRSDCEKKNEANLLGWTVFEITTDMIGTKWIEPIIKHFKKYYVSKEE